MSGPYDSVIGVERDAQCGGPVRTMREPLVGVVGQAVMDVECEDLDEPASLQHRGRMEEGGRIAAAAIRYRDACSTG